MNPVRDSIDACPIPKKDVEKITETPKTDPQSESKPSIADSFAITSFQERSALSYNVHSDKKRLAVIYNQRIFNDPTYTERFGTEKDVERLTNLLQNKLNCEVLLYDDRTKMQILNSVVEIRFKKEELLQESDSVLVFILTHGEKGNKLMARDQDYDLFEFIKQFTPENMESLAAKPKLFFVQACRGDKIDHGVKIALGRTLVRDSVDHHATSDIYSHPAFADLFVAFSSHHEHYSFRNTDGTWFIQEFCNTIDSLYDAGKLNEVDLCDIMTITNSKVAARESVDVVGGQFNEKKQVSAYYSTLIRKVFFK